MSQRQKASVSEIVERYKNKYRQTERKALRNMILKEKRDINPRTLDRHLKKAFESKPFEPVSPIIERKEKPEFLLLRFHEQVNKPIESEWSIRILDNNKHIERCSVTFNGTKLPWWDNPNELCYERLIYARGGGNLRIPKGIEKDDAEVIVRDGRTIIKKKKFKDLTLVPM